MTCRVREPVSPARASPLVARTRCRLRASPQGTGEAVPSYVGAPLLPRTHVVLDPGCHGGRTQRRGSGPPLVRRGTYNGTRTQRADRPPSANPTKNVPSYPLSEGVNGSDGRHVERVTGVQVA